MDFARGEVREQSVVALLSGDCNLYRLCRELCRDLSGNRVEVQVASPCESPLPRASFYIWDVEPGLTLPSELIRANPERHLLAIANSDLSVLVDHDLSETMVALKPLTRRTLAAFLGHAIEAAEAAGTERQRANAFTLAQSLMQASIRLQQQKHDLRTFLACVVHEFRVPLSAIQGYCGLLLRGNSGELNADQREMLRRLEHGARRLCRLTSGLQHLSVVEHTPAAEMTEGSIADSVQQAIEECRTMITDKGIDLRMRLEPPGRPLSFEQSQIDQVIINLLENACKHVPRKGSIEIRALPYFWERRCRQSGRDGPERRLNRESNPNAYKVEVRNSGPGIPQKEIETIFDAYVTIPRGASRMGGGLGLAICKSIIEEHAGAIWAEASEEGGRFAFVLPVVRASKADEDPVLEYLAKGVTN